MSYICQECHGDMIRHTILPKQGFDFVKKEEIYKCQNCGESGSRTVYTDDKDDFTFNLKEVE